MLTILCIATPGYSVRCLQLGDSHPPFVVDRQPPKQNDVVYDKVVFNCKRLSTSVTRGFGRLLWLCYTGVLAKPNGRRQNPTARPIKGFFQLMSAGSALPKLASPSRSPYAGLKQHQWRIDS